jgi:chromosome segregation ATPase
MLIQNENNIVDICQMFKKALSIAETKKGFSEKCIKVFSRVIFDNNQCKNVFLEIDLLKWERYDRDRIYKLVKSLETKNIISLTSPEMKRWIEKNKFETPNRITIIEETLSNLKKISHDEKQIKIIEMLKQTVDEVKYEIETQNKKLNDSYRTNHEEETENIRLRNALSKKEGECFSLSNEIKRQTKEISELKKQNADLRNNLSVFSQMADATKKDEIYTLKNDIKNALQNEYRKYIETKNSEYSEDIFEAFKARFFRIFATLKRLGISFEEDV